MDNNGLIFIDDISFYRDISNDFHAGEATAQISKIKALENQALDLFHRQHDLQKGHVAITVAVVGVFSSGKSTFINSILGSIICPMNDNPSTSSITTFLYADQDKIVRQDGDQEVIYDKEEYRKHVQHAYLNDASKNKGSKYSFKYYCPIDALRGIELVDTPGFENSRNEFDTEVTVNAIQHADILIYLMDVNTGELSSSTLNQLEQLRQEAKAKDWYIVFNKVDQKSKAAVHRIRDKAKKNHGKIFKGFLLYSAKDMLDEQETLRSTAKVVDQIKDNIHTAMNDGVDVDVEIKGILDKPNYRLRYNNIEKVIPRTKPLREGISSRKGMLMLFDDFRNSKEDIINKELISSYYDYLSEKKAVLNSVNRYLRDEIKRLNKKGFAETNQVMDSFQKKIGELYEEIIERTPYILKNALNKSLKAKEIPQDRKAYWSTPYAEIVVNSNKLYRCLIANPNWKWIEQELRALAMALKDDIGFTSMYENLSSKIQDVKHEGVKYTKLCFHDKMQQESATEFENIDKAKEEKQRRIEAFLDDEAFCSAPLKAWLKYVAEVKGDIREHQGENKGKKSSSKEHLEHIRKKVNCYLQKEQK